MSRPKTCATCAHRSGGRYLDLGGICLKTGFHCETQRRYPTGGCDENFDGWVQREPLFQRIALALWRRADPTSIPSQET